MGRGWKPITPPLLGPRFQRTVLWSLEGKDRRWEDCDVFILLFSMFRQEHNMDSCEGSLAQKTISHLNVEWTQCNSEITDAEGGRASEEMESCGLLKAPLWFFSFKMTGIWCHVFFSCVNVASDRVAEILMHVADPRVPREPCWDVNFTPSLRHSTSAIERTKKEGE